MAASSAAGEQPFLLVTVFASLSIYSFLDQEIFFVTLTQGAHHIGLTVPDLTAARDFFVNILEFNQVGEVPAYPAFFLSDGTTLLTLWQAAEQAMAIPFDRKNNIGLHHFALRVDGLETLHSLHSTLKSTQGVEIEFAPEPLGDGPTQHMMFYIPSGIRMELIAPGA